MAKEKRRGSRRATSDELPLTMTFNFPVASVSTLHRLLSQPPPPPPSLRGDEACARRHEVAAAVHASWTQRGTEVAGLAER